MTILDIITLVITVGGLISALSLIFGKIVSPINKEVKQVEENKRNLIALDAKFAEMKAQRREDNTFDREVRSLLLESLIAILEALEKSGADGPVTAAKRKIIEFLSKKL